MVHSALVLLFYLFYLFYLFGNFLRLFSFLGGVALKPFVFLSFYSLVNILITSSYSNHS
jgi:hypothetical protein